MSEGTPQPQGEPQPTPAPLPVPEPAPPLPVPSPPALPPISRWFPDGSGFKSFRDLVLFIGGLVVLGQQIFFAETISTLIISIGAAATGLPIVLRTDSRSK